MLKSALRRRLRGRGKTTWEREKGRSKKQVTNGPHSSAPQTAAGDWRPTIGDCNHQSPTASRQSLSMVVSPVGGLCAPIARKEVRARPAPNNVGCSNDDYRESDRFHASV